MVSYLFSKWVIVSLFHSCYWLACFDNHIYEWVKDNRRGGVGNLPKLWSPMDGMIGVD